MIADTVECAAGALAANFFKGSFRRSLGPVSGRPSEADRLDVAWSQRWLRADEFALNPRSAA
jgi:hypothetical protein